MGAVALTIAGSDSSGGAGIQADLKTFCAFRVYGASVITALTAQNTRGVSSIVELAPDFVAAQYDAVVDDLDIGAAKTGMLAETAIIEAVAERLRARPLPCVIVDPVMVATSGDVLLRSSAVESVRSRIVPIASLVTPNMREAEVLTERPVRNATEMREAARALVRMGARAALVKGGHLEGDEAIDIFYDGGEIREFRAPRVHRSAIHGAGCTFSAAIAACVARGDGLIEAIIAAKRFVTRAIETAPSIGHGATPLNHLLGEQQTG
jgi:hydroxymethylpyrimidine/phosphomethylpyrimidine kinase